jgi:hypothetical protein
MQRLRETAGAGVAQRVFVGKTREKAAALTLSDPQGRPRLLLMVDEKGAPRLEFMDEKGAVFYRLPSPAASTGEKKTKP